MAFSKKNNTKILHFPQKLTESMGEIFNYPLTIIEAPIGYGKTTALKELLNHNGVKILWLSVTNDNLIEFWNSFCRKIGEVDATCSMELYCLGFPYDGITLQRAVLLLEQIAFLNPTVFIIEDYYLVENNEINYFLEYVVKNEIPNFNLVLTTRYIELDHIHELRLKGYLLYISKDFFQFSVKDIQLYYKLCGVFINEKDAATIYHLTEGWISAIYLMLSHYTQDKEIINTDDICTFLEKAIYKPFSEEIQDFLLAVSILDSFTLDQAKYLCQNENIEALLYEIIRKNALVSFHNKNQTFHIHNIFKKLLNNYFQSKKDNYKKEIYARIATWYYRNENYLLAMEYYYLANDFHMLLTALKLDKGKSIHIHQRDSMVKYYKECPREIISQHPQAYIIFAYCFFTLNEFKLIPMISEEFSFSLNNNNIEQEELNQLRGEFEILLLMVNNHNIKNSYQSVESAFDLLKCPIKYFNTKGNATFGCPSVLFLYYRKSGKLRDSFIKNRGSFTSYFNLTNGHGMGADTVFEAELYFLQGDFDNAEIAIQKSIYEANKYDQIEIKICGLFLQTRIAMIKGNLNCFQRQYHNLQLEMNDQERIDIIHMLEICQSFIMTNLKRNQDIPDWIAAGDFSESKLLLPSLAFFHIVYGKFLLVNKEFLKLLGSADYFIDTTFNYSNLLGQIYIHIYSAAANKQVHRFHDSIINLKSALNLAIPDEIYVPFVENCEYIKPVLEEIYREGVYKEEIQKILELYKPYQTFTNQFNEKCFIDEKSKLTERELQIVKLAVEGFSNKEIGEKLFTSQNTVKKQLKSIFKKLGINSRALLYQYFES